MAQRANPALTALVDQARAATREAAGAFLAAAAGADRVEYVPVAGGRAVMLARLAQRIDAGATATCRHVRAGRPVPLTWLAWAPGLLRCVRCTAAAAAAMTEADVRCHGCEGGDRSTAVLTRVLLPAVVVARLLPARGPLTAVFGLATTTAGSSSRVSTTVDRSPPSQPWQRTSASVIAAAAAAVHRTQRSRPGAHANHVNGTGRPARTCRHVAVAPASMRCANRASITARPPATGTYSTRSAPAAAARNAPAASRVAARA